VKYKAYICSKDAQYHIPDDFGGIDIYFSEKSLRAHKTCIDSDDKWGCKVVEIELIVPDVIEDDI